MRAATLRKSTWAWPLPAPSTEATRCIACAKPGCSVDCPVGVKIKEVVALIYAGDFLAAAAKMREDNALPAITGRVCPQESQCEGGCVLGKKGEPVAIGNLERFIADYERRAASSDCPPSLRPRARAWPLWAAARQGFQRAGDLIQKGHRVRVFEALHELGGVLVYGIPEFRLPKAIVKEEVDNLRRMGVEFETNVVVGKSVTHRRTDARGRLRRGLCGHRRGPARVSRRARRAPERRLLGQRVPHPHEPDARLPVSRIRSSRSTTAAIAT